MKALGFNLLALLAAMSAGAGTNDFVVIALPDTQHYSQSDPATFHAQTRWIAERAAAMNIKFVTHLGDVTDEGYDDNQWRNANAAMNRLDTNGIPYGVCLGNHDIPYHSGYYDPNSTNFVRYFGPNARLDPNAGSGPMTNRKFTGKAWYGGASPSGLSSYQIFSAGRHTLLALHLACETPLAEINWAQSVLNEHRDKPTIISTHRYIYDWGFSAGRYSDAQYAIEPLYNSEGEKAQTLFNRLVYTNKQVCLILCGHCYGEYRMTSKNAFGLDVHEILADYQDEDNGGDGWLRVLIFKPDSNQLQVRTYSPTKGRYDSGVTGAGESEFLLSLNLDSYQTPVSRTNSALPAVFGACSSQGGGMVIRWQSRTNDRYYVLRATNIFAPFMPIHSNAIEATPPENVFTDRFGTARQYFYSIQSNAK